MRKSALVSENFPESELFLLAGMDLNGDMIYLPLRDTAFLIDLAAMGDI
jgi:hypothetical protein